MSYSFSPESYGGTSYTYPPQSSSLSSSASYEQASWPSQPSGYSSQSSDSSHPSGSDYSGSGGQETSYHGDPTYSYGGHSDYSYSSAPGGQDAYSGSSAYREQKDYGYDADYASYGGVYLCEPSRRDDYGHFPSQAYHPTHSSYFLRPSHVTTASSVSSSIHPGHLPVGAEKPYSPHEYPSHFINAAAEEYERDRILNQIIGDSCERKTSAPSSSSSSSSSSSPLTAHREPTEQISSGFSKEGRGSSTASDDMREKGGDTGHLIGRSSGEMSKSTPGEFDGLDKWDSAAMKPWTTLAIFAPRGGGKSFCIRDLLYKNRYKFPAIIVICPTEACNRFYQGIIPNIFIFDSLNAETVDAIKGVFIRQKALLHKLPPWMKCIEDITVLIIMDDCMAEDKKYRNHQIVKDLYKMGRHYKFALWVVVQYLNDLPPDLRGNLDYCIILKTTSRSMQNKFYDFLGGFNNKEEFAQILEEYTDQYGCLVKDTTKGSTAFEKTFFWYKADKTPDDFKMNPDQWAFHNHHYVGDNMAASAIDWQDFTRDPIGMLANRAMAAASGAAGAVSAKSIKAKPFKALYKYDEKHQLPSGGGAK